MAGTVSLFPAPGIVPPRLNAARGSLFVLFFSFRPMPVAVPAIIVPAIAAQIFCFLVRANLTFSAILVFSGSLPIPVFLSIS